jgi:hypothetical protein
MLSLLSARAHSGRKVSDHRHSAHAMPSSLAPACRSAKYSGGTKEQSLWYQSSRVFRQNRDGARRRSTTALVAGHAGHRASRRALIHHVTSGSPGLVRGAASPLRIAMRLASAPPLHSAAPGFAVCRRARGFALVRPADRLPPWEDIVTDWLRSVRSASLLGGTLIPGRHLSRRRTDPFTRC